MKYITVTNGTAGAYEMGIQDLLPVSYALGDC